MIDYSVSPQALEDISGIWQYIASDSEEAADRVQAEFYGRDSRPPQREADFETQGDVVATLDQVTYIGGNSHPTYTPEPLSPAFPRSPAIAGGSNSSSITGKRAVPRPAPAIPGSCDRNY